MSLSNLKKTRIRQYNGLLLILVAGLLAHGLIFLTDYPVWDGWWLNHFLKNPDKWNWMERTYSECGRPLDLLFYAPLTWVGRPVLWAKWVGGAAWIASAVVFAQAMRSGKIIPDFDSTAIGVLAVVMPFFDVLGDLNFIAGTSELLLFWLAWWMFFIMEDLSGVKRYILRGATLLSFFISFNLNSQVAYFYAVAAVILARRCNTDSMQRFLRNPVLYIWRYHDFIVLPLIFWYWKVTFTPTHGSDATYNHVTFNLSIFIQGYTSLFCNMIPGEISAVLTSPACMISAILSGFVLYIWLRIRLRGNAGLQKVPLEVSVQFIVAGFFLLLSGAFPYVAVNQPLSFTGWWTRNAILLNVPASVMILGVAKIALNSAFARRSFLIYPVLCFVSVASIVKCNLTTLRLQALGAKDYSIINQLRKGLEGRDGVNIISLRDYFQIEGTMPFYPGFIWSYMLPYDRQSPKVLVMETTGNVPDKIERMPDGKMQRIVPIINLEPMLPQILDQTTTLPFTWRTIPDHGRTITVLAEPGVMNSDGVHLGFEYLTLKYFSPGQLDDFLNRIVRIRFTDSVK